MLSKAQGIPLAVAVSGANTHNSLGMKPLIRGIPRRPLPPRAATASTRQTPRGQGVFLRRTPHLAARARARPAHRAPRDRTE